MTSLTKSSISRWYAKKKRESTPKIFGVAYVECTKGGEEDGDES